MFILDPRLEADSLPVCDLPLCHIRLMNNARFPWLVLIPREENLREITDLPAASRQALMEETSHASNILQDYTNAYKMNIGALGNMVAQLHIHVIARFEGDAAWPNPVWGSGGEIYDTDTARALVQQLAAALK